MSTGAKAHRPSPTAIVLADRVLVLVDGQLAVDQHIDLPIPRLHRDPHFASYRESLLAALGVVPLGEGASRVPSPGVLPVRHDNRFERIA